MADWVLDIKPHSVRISSDPSPSTGWTTVTRVQAEAIQAIPRQYREGTAPAITEMDQAAKDVVDAAAEDDHAGRLTAMGVWSRRLTKPERRQLLRGAPLQNIAPADFLGFTYGED